MGERDARWMSLYGHLFPARCLSRTVSSGRGDDTSGRVDSSPFPTAVGVDPQETARALPLGKASQWIDCREHGATP
ncbi:MAG: hypothetical protein QOD06_2164 [Candidatus Binatota bacterium]|nr:hypothetical protein [Candidatus Binatota bacterium]